MECPRGGKGPAPPDLRAAETVSVGGMLAVTATKIDADNPLNGLTVGERPDPEVPDGWTTVTVKAEKVDEDALVRILKEPKNALTKQYAKLFELEEVKLTFEDSALRAVAAKALKRGTGARGLRAILEELLTEVMFDLPTREDVEEVKVTEASVVNGTAPLLEISPQRKKKEA